MRKFLLLIAVVICYNSLLAQKRITPEDASKHLGEKVIITGKIVGGKLVQRSKKTSTVLNMGNNNRSSVAIVINNDDRKNFPYKPEEYFSYKKVSVTGTITETNGKAEVLIKSPDDIKIEESGAGIEFKPLEFDGFNRFFQD